MMDFLFVLINNHWFKEVHGAAASWWAGPTLVADGPPVGRLRAVTDVAIALLDAAPSVVAEAVGAAAVAGTAGAHAWCHLGSFFQVKVHSVDRQGSDAAQEASLLGRCSPWAKHNKEKLQRLQFKELTRMHITRLLSCYSVRMTSSDTAKRCNNKIQRHINLK